MRSPLLAVEVLRIRPAQCLHIDVVYVAGHPCSLRIDFSRSQTEGRATIAIGYYDVRVCLANKSYVLVLASGIVSVA